MKILAYAAFPAIAVVAGGFIASIRPPGPATRSAVQYLAAGVAALATELPPEGYVPTVALGNDHWIRPAWDGDASALAKCD